MESNQGLVSQAGDKREKRKAGENSLSSRLQEREISVCERIYSVPLHQDLRKMLTGFLKKRKGKERP